MIAGTFAKEPNKVFKINVFYDYFNFYSCIWASEKENISTYEKVVIPTI